jgi:hypothetical protein
MNRTVILACSARKRTETCELSALARYDGPAWRTLRTNLTCMIEPPFALSAEYGLISVYREVPNYDRQLTPNRAIELVPTVSAQLVELIEEGRLRGDVFAYGGELYRELLSDARERAEDKLGREIAFTFSSGGIGEQLGQLKEFLTRTPAPGDQRGQLKAFRAPIDAGGDE